MNQKFVVMCHPPHGGHFPFHVRGEVHYFDTQAEAQAHADAVNKRALTDQALAGCRYDVVPAQ